VTTTSNKSGRGTGGWFIRRLEEMGCEGGDGREQSGIVDLTDESKVFRSRLPFNYDDPGEV
jgi:hypothetical protein